MFDTVDFFEQVVKELQENKACGFCWDFEYGRPDHTNIKKYTKHNKCCIQFFLEYFKETDLVAIDSDGLPETQYISSTFKIFIGLNSDFTKQMHKEVESCEKERGKYMSYVKPIKDCMKKVFSTSLCSGVIFESISKEPHYNYKDQNLDGLLLNGKLRYYNGTRVLYPSQSSTLTYDINMDI